MNFFQILDRELSSKVFYHSTSTNLFDGYILPPSSTNVLTEVGRKKNLDKVFFTEDYGYAKQYADKACLLYGGKPIVVRVYPVGQICCINNAVGATVYNSNWAYGELYGI